jgi:hypothetical protein
MSLLTKEQLEEIQNFHDDIGECTEPHEECFIKKLIEWNEKQPPQTAREMYQRGYAAAERDLKREPLSDEEMQPSAYFICCANQLTKIPEHFKVPYSIYVYVKQLEYQIEKSHGIGVVE